MSGVGYQQPAERLRASALSSTNVRDMTSNPAQARPASLGHIITRGEALAAGLTPAAIRHRLEAGQWRRARRGIYVVDPAAANDAEAAHRDSVAAALIAFGPGAVASHESAAILHGIDLAHAAGAVHLTRPPTSRNGRHEKPGVVERAAALPRHHLDVVRGIAATSVARTVVDLARHLPLETALVSIDSALRRGVATDSALSSVRDDCATWPGAHAAGIALRVGDARSESALESLSRGVMIVGGIPLPELQCVISDDDGVIGRVDYLWPSQKLIGEADGRAKYENPAALWAEKLREDRLRAAGFRVIRWNWVDVTVRRDAFLRRLSRALGL